MMNLKKTEGNCDRNKSRDCCSGFQFVNTGNTRVACLPPVTLLIGRGINLFLIQRVIETEFCVSLQQIHSKLLLYR